MQERLNTLAQKLRSSAYLGLNAQLQAWTLTWHRRDFPSGWREVLVLQNRHTQPTQLPFLWSEPPADHAYWDQFKIVLLRWTSAFFGTCFGFISLFKNQEDMTTSGTERLSNAIPDFPLAHESVLNTINYWIHRGFFWKAALIIFYSISRFDTLWYLVINLCLSTWWSKVLLGETRQQFPDWSSQITRKQEWQLMKPVTEDTDVLPPACLFLRPRRWYQLSKAKFSGQTPSQHSWMPQASSIHNSYKEAVTG